jgi:hypothetical protein
MHLNGRRETVGKTTVILFYFFPLFFSSWSLSEPQREREREAEETIDPVGERPARLKRPH